MSLLKQINPKGVSLQEQIISTKLLEKGKVKMMLVIALAVTIAYSAIVAWAIAWAFK